MNRIWAGPESVLLLLAGKARTRGSRKNRIKSGKTNSGGIDPRIAA